MANGVVADRAKFEVIELARKSAMSVPILDFRHAASGGRALLRVGSKNAQSPSLRMALTAFCKSD
jgi:hypothetical protein